MRARRLTILLLSCTLLSCYRPDYSGPYSCDPMHGAADCPDGFRCQDRLCVAPGTATPDMSAATTGCTGDGTLLAMAHGGRAWACAGTFAAGNYAALCSSATASHVCGQESGDDSLLMLIDCDGLDGFYLAQQNISLMGGSDAMCDAPPGGNMNAILGCGTGAGAIKITSQDCHGLHHAIRCPASGAWSCSSQMGLRDVAHDGASDSNGGTLCCSNNPR